MRAHDVRKLAQCEYCGELGAMTADLATKIESGLVLKIRGLWLHPRHAPWKALVELPAEQRGQIRLCDVGADMMHRLLEV